MVDLYPVQHTLVELAPALNNLKDGFTQAVGNILSDPYFYSRAAALVAGLNQGIWESKKLMGRQKNHTDDGEVVVYAPHNDWKENTFKALFPVGSVVIFVGDQIMNAPEDIITRTYDHVAAFFLGSLIGKVWNDFGQNGKHLPKAQQTDPEYGKIHNHHEFF